MATQKKNSTELNKEKIISDIKKEINSKVKKQITNEVIADIKKEVVSIAKDEVVSDLNKRMDASIKKSNKRILKGRRGKIIRRDIIIIILLCIIGYLLYFMYNHNYVCFNINSNLNNVSIDNDKKVIKSEEDYSYLLDKVNVKLPISNINSLYLYTGNYSVSNIDNSIKLSMAYNSINNDTFTKDDMKGAYISLFGTDKYYKDISFDYECKHFKYDNDTYYLTNDECINSSSKEIIENIIKTDKKDNKIIISTVMGIYDKESRSLYNYKNLYEPIAANINNNFNILDYQNKLNTYKYVFVKKNNDYIFEKIEVN